MVNIFFKHMQIGRISKSSGVFSGNNVQVHRINHMKINEAQGTILGENNVITENDHKLNDRDLVDFWPNRGKS